MKIVSLRHGAAVVIALLILTPTLRAEEITLASYNIERFQRNFDEFHLTAKTGKDRLPSLPEVPTFAESGFPDYDMVYRFGFLAPAATPAAIITRMRDEVAKAGNKPRLRELLTPQGARAVASTPAQYAALIEREMRMWKTVIDKAGVKVE